MATLVASQPTWLFASVDMGARAFMFPLSNAEGISVSPNDITVTYAGSTNAQHYYGLYNIVPVDDDFDVTGTITGFEQIYSGASAWSVSGLTISVDAWGAYLEADDFHGFYAEAFAGND